MSPLFLFLSVLLLRVLVALSNATAANSDAKVILFSKSAIPSLIFLSKTILFSLPVKRKKNPALHFSRNRVE